MPPFQIEAAGRAGRLAAPPPGLLVPRYCQAHRLRAALTGELASLAHGLPLQPSVRACSAGPVAASDPRRDPWRAGRSLEDARSCARKPLEEPLPQRIESRPLANCLLHGLLSYFYTVAPLFDPLRVMSHALFSSCSGRSMTSPKAPPDGSPHGCVDLT